MQIRQNITKTVDMTEKVTGLEIVMFLYFQSCCYTDVFTVLQPICIVQKCSEVTNFLPTFYLVGYRYADPFVYLAKHWKAFEPPLQKYLKDLFVT